MAQAVRHDEVELESLLSQAKQKALSHAKQKALLQKDSQGQKLVFCQANGNDKDQQDQQDQKTHEAYLHARELTYANRNDWKFAQGRAELKGSKVLHVSGEYSTEKLEVGSYDVYFEVMLKDDFNIESPVKLTLTPPDGSTQTDKKDLMNYSKNRRIWLKAGKFFNRVNVGDIKLAISGTESTTSKKDLVIYGVLIV